MEAFAYNLNTSCSKVDAVYNQFGQTYPTPKIYNITYGTGGTYDGSIRVKCEGTQFVVSGISSQNLSNPVEQVGDTAFGITQPGWYQITLMGEAGISGGVADSGGGILIANTYYNADTLITIKGIKGNTYASTDFGGAGVALWNEIDITGVPTLTAGGGCGGSDNGGGGIVGGWQHRGDGLGSSGYSYTGSRGNNQSYCSGGNNYCSTAGGGMKWGSSPYVGFGGTGSSLSDCISGGFNNCAIIAGGQAVGTSTGSDYLASTYGNWGTNTLTGGKGYASIVYCGASQSDCPVACSSDSDCSSGECNFSTGLCANACNSIAACNNGDASFCALLYRNGINTSCANLVASCSDLSYPTAAKICYSETNCVETCCSSSSLTLPKNQEYVVSDSISTLSNYSAVYNLATIPICAGQFRFNLMGEGGVWSSYSPNTWNAAGGGRIVTKSFTENTNITFKVAPGGYNSSTKMGGAGVGIYEGSEIKVAVGGGGSYGPAGGGYQTGALQSGGTSGKGFVSGVAWCYCNNSDPSNCDWAFGCGGMGNNGGWPSGHVWGGSAFLDPSYTQESYTIGGNYTRDPYKYSTASWGNHGPGWAKMTVLGM